MERPWAALVAMVSANSHDKAMEMVMTAAFVTPLGAIIGSWWRW